MKLSKNFDSVEFDSPDQPGSGQAISRELVEILQMIRDFTNVPMIITSGVRTPQHNKLVRGKSDSAHLTGMAVDIACTSSKVRSIYIRLAILYGITRIGVGKNFLHFDIDQSKQQHVVWLY